MNMERNQGIQFLSREEIRAYQEKRMAEALDYVSKNSPFYSKLFSDNHIDISKIRSLDDLSCIPVTTKPDLQSRNQDFVCVPPSEIVDYPTTSGPSATRSPLPRRNPISSIWPTMSSFPFPRQAAPGTTSYS